MTEHPRTSCAAPRLGAWLLALAFASLTMIPPTLAAPPTCETGVEAGQPGFIGPLPPAKPASTNPRRFLLVGDSHMQGPLGWALDYLLRAGVKDSTVATYAMCASGPWSWATGRIKHHCGKLERGEDYKIDADAPGTRAHGMSDGSHKPTPILGLLKKHTPDAVILGLGENLKGFSDERVTDMVSALIHRLECYKRGVDDEATCKDLDLTNRSRTRALRCVWIMPHYSRSKGSVKELEHLYELMTGLVGDTCQIIDSRALTCTKGLEDSTFVCDSGNYHLPPQRYRLWALNVMDRLTELLKLEMTSDDFTANLRSQWY